MVQPVTILSLPFIFSGVFGVVNNAGTNFLGDVELTTMQQFSAITNVNQLGMVRVTKAFIPDVRKNRGLFAYLGNITKDETTAPSTVAASGNAI